MVVMGSGGHTTEMLKLIKSLPANYTPRIYLVATNDDLTENKISTQEKAAGEFTILKIRRSRGVKQKWLSAIFTTLLALYDCLKIYLKQRPDLLLVNGPGTCIPMCMVSFIFKVFFLRSSTIIFIESICRVRSLSLSGRIMYYLADQFVVQWSSLTRDYPYSTYLGWIF